jgi:hypothetical protein
MKGHGELTAVGTRAPETASLSRVISLALDEVDAAMVPRRRHRSGIVVSRR